MPLGRETRPKATSLRRPRHPKGGVGADGRDACLGCFTSFLFIGSFSSQVSHPARLISQILQGEAWGIVIFLTPGEAVPCAWHTPLAAEEAVEPGVGQVQTRSLCQDVLCCVVFSAGNPGTT